MIENMHVQGCIGGDSPLPPPPPRIWQIHLYCYNSDDFAPPTFLNCPIRPPWSKILDAALHVWTLICVWRRVITALWLYFLESAARTGHPAQNHLEVTAWCSPPQCDKVQDTWWLLGPAQCSSVRTNHPTHHQRCKFCWKGWWFLSK